MAIRAAMNNIAHSLRVGMAWAVLLSSAGPPGSTMVLLAVRSWSPSPPSVSVSVTLLRSLEKLTRLAANGYHTSVVGLLWVRPYFMYTAPTGIASV